MTNNYHHGDLKNALIQAGLEVLAEEGLPSLSLRKVAKRVGVSHAAPYAHFADKQALVAAIATEGYKKLTEQISLVIQEYPDNPLAQLIETAWVYIEFAMQDPDYFKLIFAGAVEHEEDYPDYVEQSKRGFALVIEIVTACQQINILKPADTDLLAISIWASIHGLIQLNLGNQLPSAVLDKFSLRQMLVFHLQQFMLTPIDLDFG